jgi:alpha-tubulin suppressor-like RCC1 family protein
MHGGTGQLEAHKEVAWCPPSVITALADKTIVDVSACNEHSLAVEEDGTVYAWGFGGSGRLGMDDEGESRAAARALTAACA